MARAPRPGSTASDQETERLGLRITFRDRTLTLHLDDLGPNDDLAARKETGFPVAPFINDDRFSTDSICVLWWMARRKNGERRLRYQDVVKTWPGLVELGRMFDDGTLAIEEITADTDVDDLEVLEAGPDPLPPGER